MNQSGDTSLGGAKRLFPETTLGLLSRLGDPATGAYKAGLEELLKRYWKPIYRYLRIRWSKPNDDAKDLTQAFFLWLMEGEALTHYAAERGSFRNYLKILLSRFGGHQQRAMETLKRGGGIRTFALDDDPALRDEISDPRADDPGAAFDREWLKTLAATAVDRVRLRYHQQKKAVAFTVYESYDLVDPDRRPTYPALAQGLGLTEPEARHHLAEVRAAIRQELRDEIGRLTTSDHELQEEWNALFGA